jgi:hypothetical protein
MVNFSVKFHYLINEKKKRKDEKEKKKIETNLSVNEILLPRFFLFFYYIFPRMQSFMVHYGVIKKQEKKRENLD